MTQEETAVAESTATETPESASETTTATPSWTDHLPEDLRGDEAFKPIKAETSDQAIGEMAKMYVSAQRMVGADKIAVPTKEADAGEWRAFWGKLGCPEEAGGYEVPKENMPEGFDAVLFDALRPAAHRLGISRQQYAGMARELAGLQHQQQETDTTLETQLIETWHKDIRKEFGDAHDESIALGKRVVQEFGGDELANLLNETGYGDHPVIVKFMAKVGREIAEDEILGSGGSHTFKNTPTQAQDAIRQLQLDQGFMAQYTDRNHPSHKAAVEQMNKLFQEAHPSA